MYPAWTKDFWKEVSVKAARTFAQTALAFITIGVALTDIDWLYVISVGGVAALVSILMSILGLPTAKTYWGALAERSVKTFIQSFTGFIAVNSAFDEISWVPALSASAVAAVAALLMGVANGSDIKETLDAGKTVDYEELKYQPVFKLIEPVEAPVKEDITPTTQVEVNKVEAPQETPEGFSALHFAEVQDYLNLVNQPQPTVEEVKS